VPCEHTRHNMECFLLTDAGLLGNVITVTLLCSRGSHEQKNRSSEAASAFFTINAGGTPGPARSQDQSPSLCSHIDVPRRSSKHSRTDHCRFDRAGDRRVVFRDVQQLAGNPTEPHPTILPSTNGIHGIPGPLPGARLRAGLRRLLVGPPGAMLPGGLWK